MKKLLYACLIIFFASGAGLFYLFDKNSVMIKEKFVNFNGIITKSHEGNDSSIVISSPSREPQEIIKKNYGKNLASVFVDIPVGTFKIIEGDTTDFELIIKGAKEQISKMEYTQVQENLKIMSSSDIDEVILKVPKGKFLSGSIRVDVGTIEVVNLKDFEAQLKTGSFSGSNLENIKSIEVGTGDMEITNSKNIGNLSVDIGNLEVEILEQNKDFNFVNKLGNIDVKINNSFNGGLDTKVGLGEQRLNNLKLNGSKFKGKIDVEMGQLSVEGED